MQRIYVVVVAALALAGCAQPATAGGDDLGSGVGGNGSDGASGPPLDLARHAPDMMPVCGDGVCSAASGEACDTCPDDCGACAQCAPGTADCNHSTADGCEVDVTHSPDCGACGRVCAAAGGINSCVQKGSIWVCQPNCDINHADCDGDSANGCETDITTVSNCGGCGRVCSNPHGSSSCVAAGSTHSCSYGCAGGFADCDSTSAGCETDVGGNSDDCGGCGRACSAVDATSRACSGGLCTPACSLPFADCSRPAAPAADDGCETNGTVDHGENDNACNGQYTSTGEGGTSSVGGNRILPTGDADTFQVHLSEGSHTCFPGFGQSYDALIQLTPPSGVDLRLRYNLGGCNNSWTNPGATALCVSWSGTCGGTDDRDYFVQVFGNAGANSCLDYTLTIVYASEGDKAPGCQ